MVLGEILGFYSPQQICAEILLPIERSLLRAFDAMHPCRGKSYVSYVYIFNPTVSAITALFELTQHQVECLNRCFHGTYM